MKPTINVVMLQHKTQLLLEQVTTSVSIPISNQATVLPVPAASTTGTTAGTSNITIPASLPNDYNYNYPNL